MATAAHATRLSAPARGTRAGSMRGPQAGCYSLGRPPSCDSTPLSPPPPLPCRGTDPPKGEATPFPLLARSRRRSRRRRLLRQGGRGQSSESRRGGSAGTAAAAAEEEGWGTRRLGSGRSWCSSSEKSVSLNIFLFEKRLESVYTLLILQKAIAVVVSLSPQAVSVHAFEEEKRSPSRWS